MLLRAADDACWAPAIHLPATGLVGTTVEEELRKNPGFGLWVVGHSLGAGVASLLVALWREKYPYVHGRVPLHTRVPGCASNPRPGAIC